MKPVEVGDRMLLGKYEQSSDYSNGKEDIEWRVLAVENGKALLLSEKILDCKPYNEECEAVTWETCTLRKWLNSDFYSATFKSDEQTRIFSAKVKNENNPWGGTNGGNDTKDKLFLLSFSDVVNTAYGFSGSHCDIDISRQAQGSDYAERRGLDVYTVRPYSENSNWWLRSPGNDSYSACCCYYNGYMNYYDCVDLNYIGVRPALWLNL